MKNQGDMGQNKNEKFRGYPESHIVFCPEDGTRAADLRQRIIIIVQKYLSKGIKPRILVKIFIVYYCKTQRMC